MAHSFNRQWGTVYGPQDQGVVALPHCISHDVDHSNPDHVGLWRAPNGQKPDASAPSLKSLIIRLHFVARAISSSKKGRFLRINGERFCSRDG
jgi:hypothetical protein